MQQEQQEEKLQVKFLSYLAKLAFFEILPKLTNFFPKLMNYLPNLANWSNWMNPVPNLLKLPKLTKWLPKWVRVVPNLVNGLPNWCPLKIFRVLGF
jgi:hypothetical protein